MFNPESVDEFYADRYVNETAYCVYRRDYMKLLDLYHDLQTKLNVVLMSLSDDL